MELRWWEDSNGDGGGVHCNQLLIITGLLSLIARLTHLRQPKSRWINNVGASRSTNDWIKIWLTYTDTQPHMHVAIGNAYFL